MNPVPSPGRRPPTEQLVAGAVGGVEVLVLGGTPLATGVVGSTDTKTVVREPVVSRPASSGSGKGQTVNGIYKQVGPGVVFIQARGVSDNSPFGLPGQQ